MALMMINSPNSAILACKNHMDEGVSLMEKAAKKIQPIIKEVVQRLVGEKKRVRKQTNKKGSNVLFNFKDNPKQDVIDADIDKDIDDLMKSDGSKYDMENIMEKPDFDMDNEFEEKLDMRAVLGYFNQNEWVNNINIGNIMQINPFSVDEFLTCHKNEYQLGRTSFLDKISLLAVGYF
jgi:hypothetical protein